MFEMIMNPRKAERHPWELFFIGLFYASLSIVMVNWVFARDVVLSQYSGILLVTFTVMFSMPFVYFTLKLEEKRITPQQGTVSLLKEHRRALFAFLWLFLGFVVALSFWYIVLDAAPSFKAQIETYCLINKPTHLQECAQQYGIKASNLPTGLASGTDRLLLIFTNNIYVLMFTLVFSLVFGAGVIFVLSWNASVIAAAIGIFTKSEITALPMGLLRYLLHGLPEIASYFIVAMAGGMVSVAVIRHEIGTEKFWEVLQDSLNLVVLAVVILFAAALLEVYVTPLFF